MDHIPAGFRRFIETRARGRYEYCGLSQIGQEATFHVDHIVPTVKGGRTVEENLALACVSCSLRKEARRTGQDPQTGRKVSLFHPRKQSWSRHFRWNGVEVEGRTAIGRATIQALGMNRPVILLIRTEETERGRHPPPDA